MLDAASFVSTQAVKNACKLPYVHAFSFYNGGLYGVSPEQPKIAIDNGKWFSPNWERRANEALYGSGAWAVDSARAVDEAWGVDWQKVPTIFSGVDFSAVQSQYAQLDYWHETLCDRADNINMWIGYYGQTAYGNHLIQQPFWTRRNRSLWTWGGSGEINGNHAKQYAGFPSGNDYSSVGVIVDESEGREGLVVVSSFDSAIPAPEVNLTYSILAVEGCYARFAGMSDPKGFFDQVHWINAGSEKWLRDQGCPTITKPLSALPGIILVGPLPTDDVRVWKESDWLIHLTPAAAPYQAVVDMNAIAQNMANRLTNG